jgi:hypothetical protein
MQSVLKPMSLGGAAVREMVLKFYRLAFDLEKDSGSRGM